MQSLFGSSKPPSVNLPRQITNITNITNNATPLPSGVPTQTDAIASLLQNKKKKKKNRTKIFRTAGGARGLPDEDDLVLPYILAGRK